MHEVMKVVVETCCSTSLQKLHCDFNEVHSSRLYDHEVPSPKIGLENYLHTSVKVSRQSEENLRIISAVIIIPRIVL